MLSNGRAAGSVAMDSAWAPIARSSASLAGGMLRNGRAAGSVAEDSAWAPCDLQARGFVCIVCQTTFKRETSLMLHMASHRQRSEEQPWNVPVQCAACPKVFATKYQAKKHFLRRHFEGERRFSCSRCQLKHFAVKEDLTSHMKTCGRTHACACGARCRTLGVLKQHCAQAGHTPAVAGEAAGLKPEQVESIFDCNAAAIELINFAFAPPAATASFDPAATIHRALGDRHNATDERGMRFALGDIICTLVTATVLAEPCRG